MMSFQYIMVLWSAFVTGTLAGRSDRQVVGIYGGDEIPIETVPEQVSLQYHSKHLCGGVIIDRLWILTAAHCVKKDRHNHDIRAGSSKRQTGGSIHNIDNIIIHPDYRSVKAPAASDIALIIVREPFSIDATRKIAKLFDENEKSTVGEMAIVSGWGRTEEDKCPILLRSVQVRIMAEPKCKKYYPGLMKGELCAGFNKGGKDACGGDSGGPLTIKNRVVGIVAWGTGCGKPKCPGVYTEIAYFRRWIRLRSGV